MAVYEALLLNTVVPQIQAAQTGDSYVMVVNATTPALRITQTGTGNALEVEDSANPDATPFVVSAAGDVGIGTNAPPTKLYVTASVSSTAIAAFFNTDTANGNGVYIKAGGANAGKYALAVDNAASASLLYLESSGNLGIGTNAPSTKLHVAGETLIQPTTASNAKLSMRHGSVAANNYFEVDSSSNTIFATNNAERARITSGGDLLVGTTSGAERLVVSGTINNYVIKSIAPSTSGTYYHILFDDAGTSHGSITSNGTNTAYNTTSDYRLKDNPQPLTNSGAFIDALKPKTWNWKADGSKGVGFIAHEVQEVSPGSVVGEKDGEQMQAMEYGSAEFIANIVAELQSLRARVAQLEQGA